MPASEGSMEERDSLEKIEGSMIGKRVTPEKDRGTYAEHCAGMVRYERSMYLATLDSSHLSEMLLWMNRCKEEELHANETKSVG